MPSGAVATFFLYLAGRVLVLALQRLRGGVGVAWRYGVANVARRGRESSVQIVAFGIGLMVLLLLKSVRTELMAEWQATLPENAPNHFLINIQPAERDALAPALVAAGVPEPRLTPARRRRQRHTGRALRHQPFTGRDFARRLSGRRGIIPRRIDAGGDARGRATQGAVAEDRP